MSLFNNLLSKIFNHAPTSSTSAGLGGSGANQIDITPILDALAAKNSEPLNWKNSVVDLMKLVGMDSSLSERKKLAQELNYSGDLGDSASMNQWLHKEVLRKIAANGGKVPANLVA